MMLKGGSTLSQSEESNGVKMVCFFIEAQFNIKIKILNC